MKKIGIVTLWSHNYGSVLQCYAMKKVLHNMGYRGQVYYQEESGFSRYILRGKSCVKLVVNTILHPSYLKAFFDIKKASEKSKNGLLDESAKKLGFFAKTQIQPKGCSYKELKRISRSKNVEAFIAGSDQIWNGSIPYYPTAFLKFAPKDKRIAYAPSFGTAEIAAYNKRKFAYALRQFKHLSARESEGCRIIESLTGRKAERLPDPTILLSNEEWESFSGEIKRDKGYVLAHFLDTPSKTAIILLQEYLEANNIGVVLFGYSHDELYWLQPDVIAGTPEEYISLIRNADEVWTDSFHTSLFSIRFGRQFYVFPRQYQHKHDQTSRIDTLLNCCKYEERLIRSATGGIVALPTTLHNCDRFIESEQKKAFAYLDMIFPNEKKGEKSSLASEDECVGCGICELSCPVKAIRTGYNDKGYCVPVIDEKLCVKCGVCENKCSAVVKMGVTAHSAYIAYNTNSDMQKKSASGGVYSAVASRFISNGGVVYGTRMEFGDEISIRHEAAYNEKELICLLKSKYVQSDCRNAFVHIKNNLNAGQKVLFCGTSCQVAALYKYWGKRHDLLYTMDLICHGVPGTKLFEDYIEYLENKTGSRVTDFDFRVKEDGIKYIEKVCYSNGQCEKTAWEKSLYYRQFLQTESYRDSCYYCKYATIDKPADITIGDYFEARMDYPEFFEGEPRLGTQSGISCMIVHNDHGRKLVEEYGKDLHTIEVDIRKVQSSHNQLCFPSRYSSRRNRFFRLYRSAGFQGVAAYYKVKDFILYVPKLIYKSIIDIRHREN